MKEHIKDLLQRLTATQNLLEQFGSAKAKTSLIDLPDQIRAKRGAVAEARINLQDASNYVKEAEAILTAIIAGEVGENGKPKYSNAEARAAELLIRKRKDSTCRDAEDTYRLAEQTANNAQFDLDLLCDKFRAYRTVGKIIAAELSVLGIDGEDCENEDDRNDEPF